MIGQTVAFLALSAVVICTPGPDTALTIRNAIAAGRRGGMWTAAGVAAGQAVWTVAAAAGIAGLLAASEPAFLALKLFGAGYLLYLGVQSVRAALSGKGRTAAPNVGSRLEPARAFRQGLVNDLGNPKMAAFFMSMLPQFVPADRADAAALVTFLALGMVFCLLTLGWLAAYSVAIARARRIFERSAVRRAVDAVAGLVLIGFGVRLALTQRSP